MSQKKNFVKKGRIYRSLVASALVANGVFQFVAPVLAEGTAANQTIDNTATATYDDEDGNTINATSNTVSVTVAEVAGITVVGAGPVFKTQDDDGVNGDANGDGKFNARDQFYFVYDVENVGNDPTKFQIPGAPTVVGPGAIPTGEFVEISYDDGANWVTVPANGLQTDSVDPGDVVKVRVPVRVNDNAPSDAKISVKLGNTDPDAQNQPRTDNPDDVYTVDNDGTENGDVAGPPANGEREASATQEITVDSSLTTYALAKILKTNSNYASAGAAGPIGDTLDYNLSLEVLDTDPTGNNISPVALEGRDVNGIPGTNILVSDAIPAGTKLSTVTAPAGWTAVYSIGNPEAVPGNKANTATWQTTPPSDLATVGRVGFVKPGTVNPGTTVNGFNITVEVTSDESSVTVANVAQLFGATSNGNDVYDESGDAQPSNYDEVAGLFPGTTQAGEVPTTIADGDIDDGYIDPTDGDNNGTPDDLENTGTDTNSDNTGTGAGGEANVFAINAVGVSSLLNGPDGAPTANVGGDNNIDFTNKSANVPAGIAPGGTVSQLGTVSFTNTVQNTGNSNADIILLPQTPTRDLPPGTIVTLTYDNNGTPETAAYTYNNGTFTIANGQTPIKILAVASNDTRSYTVDVDLPDNSPLSTDAPDDGTERGYPVPIRAFVDNDGDGVADTVDDDNDPDTAEVAAQNVTINRVYVGYLKLVKESRILQGTAEDPVPGTDGTFSNAPKSPRPGNIIEYRINYENISEASGGPGNVVLNANNVQIVEDGTLSETPGDGLNNWALDNNDDGELDTINVSGTARIVDNADNPTTDATIAYDPADDETTTSYTVTAVEVAPGVIRKFTFQRRVNQVSPTGTANNSPDNETSTPTGNPAPDQ